MYIEFRLPMGAGGMAAQHANQVLNQLLHDWSDRYNIPYNKKIVKYTVRVTFDDEKNYNLFALTWNPKTRHSFQDYFANYRFIEPMNPV